MEAIVFFSLAAIALGGALGVVLARNPVHAALLLVTTLVTMAGFFVMQGAHLIAAIQIIVYASAIVVLFLFVIMLLGVDRHESLREPLRYQRPVALSLGAVLLAEIFLLSGREWVTGAARQAGDARSLAEPASGNVENVARVLFTDFFWPFQVTAVLLVVAVVGAVALARRTVADTKPPADAPLAGGEGLTGASTGDEASA